MLWVIVPVTKLLVFKIFPIPIIFAPQPLLQPAFLKILEFHMYKNHVICYQLPLPRPTLSILPH